MLCVTDLPRARHSCVTVGAHAGAVDDHEIERGAPFCANPACALHVRMGDAQVEGAGNWLRLPDGRVFGRGHFASGLLCDACGTRRGPVRIERAWIEPARQRTSKRWRIRQ